MSTLERVREKSSTYVKFSVLEFIRSSHESREDGVAVGVPGNSGASDRGFFDAYISRAPLWLQCQVSPSSHAHVAV